MIALLTASIIPFYTQQGSVILLWLMENQW
jgi:hypothetical protein